MRGHGFEHLPEGFKAFISFNNNVPSMYLGRDAYAMVVESVTRTEIVLTRTAHQSANPYYFVGIMTDANGSGILWENTTKPLP